MTTEITDEGSSPLQRRESHVPGRNGDIGSPASGRGFADLFDALTSNIAQVLHGKTETIELALMCLLAEGHLLIEDVPGVGKTSLAKAIAASLPDCTIKPLSKTSIRTSVST